MSRDQLNYPPKQRGHSCHHVAYPYHSYRGEFEHKMYQHNEALLISTPNVRHNIGRLTVHALLDDQYGPPPKPRHTLMLDAVDFMQSLDRFEPRIQRLGKVIEFYRDESEFTSSAETANQAANIAAHYAMQHMIITEGGEEFVKQQRNHWRGEAA